MNELDYWDEAVACSLSEQGIPATKEQIRNIAADMQCSHENIRLAFPVPDGPSPVQQELAEIKRQLAAERDKVICEQCGGRGRIITHGPIHSSDSECMKCRGEGRHL